MKSLSTILEGLLTGVASGSGVVSAFDEVKGIIESLKRDKNPRQYDKTLRILRDYVRKRYRTKDIVPKYDEEESVYVYDVPANPYAIHLGMDTRGNKGLYTYITIYSSKKYGAFLLTPSTRFDTPYLMYDKSYIPTINKPEHRKYEYKSDFFLVTDDEGKKFIDNLLDSLPDSK